MPDEQKKSYEDAMLDGGERTTYEGGAQREPHKGKGRYDWITPFGLERTRKAGLELRKCPDLRDKKLGVAGEMSTAFFFINEWRCGKRNRDYLALAAWMTMSAIHFEATGELMTPGGFLTMSPYALERLAIWCEKGGVKYGPRNWEKGMPYDHPLDSGMRHTNCCRKGLTEEDNLAAVLWNLFALMHYEDCGMEKFDNIPKYPEAKWRKEMAEKVVNHIHNAWTKAHEANEDKKPEFLSKQFHVGKKPLSVWMNGQKLGEAMVDLDFDVNKYIRGCEIILSEGLLNQAKATINDKAVSGEIDFAPDLKSKAPKRSYKIIIEDFDGTLCKDAYPEIGEPNWDEINYVWWAQKNGAKVILSTCREGERLDEALEWCREKGLIFDSVNENLPEMIELYGNNSRKIFGDEYRDDKAVRVKA